MTNYCYNQIVIKGKPEDLKKISEIIENLKKEDVDTSLFNSLIGLPEGTNLKKHNDELKMLFGDIKEIMANSIWDIGFNFKLEINDDYILFTSELVRLLPIHFCKELSKLYNIQLEMYFEDPDFDFCGKCLINFEGNNFEKVYRFHEGVYRFKGFEDWYKRHWELISYCLLEEIGNEHNPDLQKTISDKFSFLNITEIDLISIELNKLLEISAIGES